MSSQNISEIKAPLPVPSWLVHLQAVCFTVLYAIWILPETILIRHICLILGALLGLCPIYQYRHRFFQKRALPVWLIVALFAWAIFHLIFLSNDFAAQYDEFTGVWKRTALGAIFALGFGIVLAKNQLDELEQKRLWALIYLGLLAPTLIYIVKFILVYMAKNWGLQGFDGLIYRLGGEPFYIPKTSYVCFCLPTLAVALGQLSKNIHNNQLLKTSNAVYVLSIAAILFVFYDKNIKNGVLYGALLVVLFMVILVFRDFRRQWVSKTLVLAVVLAIGSFAVLTSIRSNDSWRTFFADVKVAQDTQTYQHWKYFGEKGYPNNEFGTMVSPTNYERIAWGKEALKLVAKNPLGYGLIDRSFGPLAKVVWPDSKLTQSHSGWIDLTLGLGLPAIAFIFATLLGLIYQLSKQCNIPPMNPYPAMICWGLLGLFMLWCTTEISRKDSFDDLIFWLSWGAGLYLGTSSMISDKNAAI